MSGHFLRPLVVAVLALRLTVALAEEPVLSPQQGVLLLRNGELIEGTITQAGDRYDVSFADGEMRIRRSDVEFVCRDVGECYERKRRHIDADKVQDHLELAEWCLRHDLMKQALGELNEAVALDPTHPRIALLERRVQAAERKVPEATAKPAQVLRVTPSRELDRIARDLPAGCLDTFKTTIQPLLLNQCSTAGCHGIESKSLPLLRTAGGRPLTRRAMLRNLCAALDTIDRDRPSSSPLLTAPMGPHGTCKAAIFSQRDAIRYRQLVQWVNEVTDSPNQAQPASVTEPKSALLQTLRTGATPAAAYAAQIEPTTGRHSGRKRPNEARLSPATPSPRPPQPPAAEESEGPEGEDPFDPEIFNRRNGGKTQ